MKTLSTKESRASSPITRRAHSAVHTPLGAKNRIQQNHIRQILQPKLIIGHSNDKYEQEADSVADRVVANQPVAEISSISGSLSSLGNQNFQAETGEDEQVQEKEIQRQAEEDEEEPVQPMLIQRQAEEDEEEPVQPMLIQRQAEEDEEEPVQPMLIQRQAEEDEEEPVQPMLIQRQAEEDEEEPVQPMLIQRQAEEDEEEPVQQMLIQRQAEEEEEEALQLKLIQLQVEEEKEEPLQPRLIQRQAEEEEAEPVQLRLIQRLVEEDEDHNLQAKRDTPSAQAASQAINNQSSGSTIRADIRSILESGTGADLSAVRVHEDSSAHQAAASINAKAFTHKNDIWLGEAQSQSDLHLMAHEATHVIQQGGGLRAADARARQVSASPQRAPDTDAAVQHSGETSTTMVQRSLFDDVTAGLGAAWDATGGALVDAAGNALDVGAEFFWNMLATLAPSLVPLLREIADKGIVAFLYDKLAAVLDGIFDRLENRGGVIATLAQTFRSFAAQATGILAALASGDCEPLFAVVGQFKEMMSQIAGDAWNAVTEFFAPVGAFFTDLWTSFGAPLVDWLQGSAADLWAWIQNLGTEIWNWTQPVRDKLGAAWDWVKDQLGFGAAQQDDGDAGLVGWVKGKAAEAWDAIKEKLQPVIEPMQAVVGKVQAVLPLDAIFNLRETVTAWLDKVGNMTASMEEEDGAAENQASLREEILPAVLNTIESLREGLVSTGHWVSGNIGAIAMTLQGLFDSLRVNPVLGGLSGGLQWLSDSLDTLTGWVQEYAVGVFTLYSNALGLLSRFVEPVLNGLQKVAEVLGNIAGKLPDLILGPVWWLMPKCIKDPIKDFLLNTILAQIPIFNQILVIPDIWEKVKSTAMTILTKVFVDGDLIGAAWTYFKAILSIIGIPAQLVVSIVKHAVTALSDILKDPIGFLLNILKAIKQGFVQFFGNILKHLYNGVVDWLFGAVSEAGLTPPADFSLKSVLDFVLQILDITRERILERMEKHPKIGKKVVDRLRAGFEVADKAWEWVKVLFTEGPAGIWRMVKDKLSGLWSSVIGSIVSWMSTKIIEQATIKLLTFLDPSFIMAFVNSVIFIYKAIQSFVQYINEMLEMINSVFAGIGAIAKGAIGNAANYLEQTLADSIPIVIGFLANQFGLGQISRRIGDMVESVRGRVDAAIDGLINLVVTAGSAFLNMLKSGVTAVKKGAAKLVGEKDHKQLADEIRNELATPTKSTVPEEAIKEKKQHAQNLQKQYQQRLTKGHTLLIELDESVTGAEKDGSINFKVRIRSQEVSTEGGADISPSTGTEYKLPTKTGSDKYFKFKLLERILSQPLDGEIILQTHKQRGDKFGIAAALALSLLEEVEGPQLSVLLLGPGNLSSVDEFYKFYKKTLVNVGGDDKKLGAIAVSAITNVEKSNSARASALYFYTIEPSFGKFLTGDENDKSEKQKQIEAPVLASNAKVLAVDKGTSKVREAIEAVKWEKAIEQVQKGFKVTGEGDDIDELIKGYLANKLIQKDSRYTLIWIRGFVEGTATAWHVTSNHLINAIVEESQVATRYPVLIGDEIPAETHSVDRQLIKYWNEPDYPTQLKAEGMHGQLEILRWIANKTDTVSMGMRSGMLEANAFSGIPTFYFEEQLLARGSRRMEQWIKTIPHFHRIVLAFPPGRDQREEYLKTVGDQTKNILIELDVWAVWKTEGVHEKNREKIVAILKSRIEEMDNPEQLGVSEQERAVIGIILKQGAESLVELQKDLIQDFEGELGESVQEILVVEKIPVHESGVIRQPIVYLNSANEDEIKSLPGIGHKLAPRIIAYIEENGPITSFDQLEQVVGIGPSRIATMQSEPLIKPVALSRE